MFEIGTLKYAVMYSCAYVWTRNLWLKLHTGVTSLVLV